MQISIAIALHPSLGLKKPTKKIVVSILLLGLPVALLICFKSLPQLLLRPASSSHDVVAEYPVCSSQELDEDGSGTVSYSEMCSRLRQMDLKPPIHLTQSDFDVITQAAPDNSSLCTHAHHDTRKLLVVT